MPTTKPFELREVTVDTRPMSLGEDIRQARERARMTQTELADALGVNESTVSNWERGRSNPKNRLGAIREVLHMDATGNHDTGDVTPDPGRPLEDATDMELIAEIARRLSQNTQTDQPPHRIVTEAATERISWPMSAGPTARRARESGEGSSESGAGGA